MRFKRFLKKVIKALYRNKTYSAHSEYKIQISELYKKLDNKIALVTGGSGEIGRAICFKLASEGAKVYVGGRNEENTEKVVQEIKKQNLIASPILVNVTSEVSISKAVMKIVEKEGRIDILVNCAGGSTRTNSANLFEQSIEMIDDMLNTNLRGSILCSREVGKYMVKQKNGKIINIGSVIGIRGKPRFTDYAASKAGIIGYTISLATEMGEYGVNVNCVSPGFIQRGIYSEEQLPYLLNTNYLKRVGTPEDIANAVAFFASSEAAFITGQNLCVDGGRSLGLHGDN